MGSVRPSSFARFVHWGGKLVLLDEPFAALGVRQTHRGLELIEQVRSRGVAVIVITHNMLHAFQVADRIVVLRQGRVAGVRGRPRNQPRGPGGLGHDWRRRARGLSVMAAPLAFAAEIQGWQ